MPKVEIDEQDLLARNNVVAQVDALLKNPESRKLLLKAQKIANPKANIPEIDTQDAITAALAEQEKKFTGQLKELSDTIAKKDTDNAVAEANKRWNSGRQSILEQGYTDDGLKAIEEFMEKNGVADHEIALAAWEKRNPGAVPITAPGPTAFNFFDKPSEDGDGSFMKAMLESHGGDDRALSAQINNVLSEGRGSR